MCLLYSRVVAPGGRAGLLELDSVKASKESSLRWCPLGDVPLSAARLGVSGVVFRASDFAWVSSGPRGGGTPGVPLRGRRLRDPRVAPHGRMVRGGCLHAPRRALVLQAPLSVGQPLMPRYLPPCPVGRHADSLVGPPPRQVSAFGVGRSLVAALLSAARVPPLSLWRPP